MKNGFPHVTSNVTKAWRLNIKMSKTEPNENLEVYLMVTEIFRLLGSLGPNNSGGKTITKCLRIAKGLSGVSSEMAYALDSLIEKIPEKSFGAYTPLLQKAFEGNSIPGYRAEKMYYKVIGLIDENIERERFLKSVLRIIDREVCASIKGALPPDHPYLKP